MAEGEINKVSDIFEKERKKERKISDELILNFKETDFSDYSFKISQQDILKDISTYFINIKKDNKKMIVFPNFVISKYDGVGTKIINQIYNLLPENISYNFKYSALCYGNGELSDEELKNMPYLKDKKDKVYAKFGLEINYVKKIGFDDIIIENKKINTLDKLILLPPIDKINEIDEVTVERIFLNAHIIPFIQKELQKISIKNIETKFYDKNENLLYKSLYKQKK